MDRHQDWTHGYFADSGYTYGYYPETMPARLRWAALMQGHKLPDSGFRYLDAGCGQGLNLILAAAAHPDSSFVGIDFLPEHIAHARELARRCGINNVRFIEADFAEVAETPGYLGEFDYAVAHGISTWVAPRVQQALFRLISRVLRPGGVFYNSYNTFPGWLGVVPFQHLVLLEQRSKNGSHALQAARDAMERLKDSSRAMFDGLPALQQRMQVMDKQDQAYLVQEYNNAYWQPMFFTQMADALAQVKLDYLGTATLGEMFDGVLPPAVRSLLAEQADATLRQQLRDYACNTAFRRDLFVKGRQRPWKWEADGLLRAQRVIAAPLTPRPAPGEPFLIRAGSVRLNGDAAFYGQLLERLEQQPEGMTTGELIDSESEPAKRDNVLQALTLLMHGGWVLPYRPSPGDAGRACNLGMAVAAYDGAPYRYACAPAADTALPFSDIDWVLLRAVAAEVPREHWPAEVEQWLRRLGRELVVDGQPVTKTEEREALLNKQIELFDTQRLPALRRLGGM